MEQTFEIWQQHRNYHPGLYHTMTDTPEAVDLEVERLGKVFPGHRFYKRTANHLKPRTI